MNGKRQLSPKEGALRKLRRKRWERRWRAVIQSAKEGCDFSLEHLIGLMSECGVPDFAGTYAADRFSGRIAPTGRPARPPLDPGDLDSLWYHFNPRLDAATTNGVASLVPLEFVAVAEVRRRHARYAAFETKREPNRRNKPDLRYIKSRGVWRVKNPKGRALCKVAAHLNKVAVDPSHKKVKPATIADWERRVREWERAVLRHWPWLRNPSASGQTKPQGAPANRKRPQAPQR